MVYLGGEWQTGGQPEAQADVSFSADASDLLMIAARNRIRIRSSSSVGW